MQETTTTTDDSAVTLDAVAAIKHGQGIRALVDARKRDLETTLTRIRAGGENVAPVNGIEEALSALAGMLTGDLDQISPTNAAELMHWMETSKHLGQEPLAAAIATDGQPAKAAATDEPLAKVTISASMEVVPAPDTVAVTDGAVA